jgi:hypothetical protein
VDLHLQVDASRPIGLQVPGAEHLIISPGAEGDGQLSRMRGDRDLRSALRHQHVRRKETP